MKKIITVLAALTLLFSCSAAVYADEQFDSAGDLFQYWEETSYPDYICGVWSTDGGITNLTFAVQNNEAGNAGKQDILDLIADDSTVTFVYQEYSKNYLLKVQEELYPYFKKDLGLISLGIDESENRIILGILEEKGNDEATWKMVEEVQEKYGDIFIVNYQAQIITTLEDVLRDVPAVVYKGNNPQGYISLACILGALLLAAVLTVVVRKQNATTLQTNTGENLSTSASLSTKEVESMVKNALMNTSLRLDEKIISEIEK